KRFKREDPQEIADLLMEEVIGRRAGEMDEDMTVVVIRLEENRGKWGWIARGRLYVEKEEIC
ncbi:hypothetical protein, partial [Bacillus altitudinis]|uniref:hypothetical protein n=1 Tax=Bacillus altitudinis TaxID=293387 RepID=UPI00164387DC